MVLKDSQREAEKKQAEAVQLEQKMNDMEKVMMELEQRYVLHRYTFILFKKEKNISLNDTLLFGLLCITDYRTQSRSANRATSQTKT